MSICPNTPLESLQNTISVHCLDIGHELLELIGGNGSLDHLMKKTLFGHISRRQGLMWIPALC